MSYNILTNVLEGIEYLEQCAGFYYLQDPTTWTECFKSLSSSAPKLVDIIGGEPVTEITNIASAYTSVGKDIYATVESGLKSAPVVEGVFTQADEEVAVVGETALGTYVAGLSVGVPLATAIAGILSGLGIGILGYETAPNGWIDISNYIFGTDIQYGDAQPLIRTYVNSLFAKDPTTNKYLMFMTDTSIKKAYDYFASHIFGGINYSFLDDTEWIGTTEHPNIPTKCTDATKHYLAGHNFNITGELTDALIENVMKIWRKGFEIFEFEMPDDIASGIISNLYSLYPNYHNANLFNVTCRYMKTYDTVNYNQICITGYRVSDNFFSNITVSDTRDLQYGVVSGSTGFNDSDFFYSFAQSPSLDINNLVFSYKYDFSTGTGVVQDTGVYDVPIVPAIGCWATGGGVIGDVIQVVTSLWNIGAQSFDYSFDEEFTNKGYIINPKTNPNANGTEKATKPTISSTLQDGYRDWMHKAKQVGQPDVNGEEGIITYIPTPIPASMPDPARLLDNGIGVANNPESYPVTPPNAMPDALPEPLSQDAPLSNPVENAIDAYNRSRVTPNTAPEPIPETDPVPKYPDTPPTEPSGDSGTTPTPVVIGGVTASGMVSVYNPSKQQLIDFSGWLWSPNFLDNFMKIFANPMDAIIGLHIMYATPTTGNSEHIVAGYLDSGISSKVVTKQYSKINCGTITIPEYYGNATDFEPYTTVHIYLPFIGIVPIKANDVLGKQVNIEYGIDALTGTCLAIITTIKDGSKIGCYTFAGNCAVQIPVSGGNYAQMITGLAGFLVSGVGAIATGNPVMALGAGASFMSSSVSVQHSGSIGANAGACGVRKPYVIITRRKSYDAQNYQHFYGFPSNNHIKLGNCVGYTQVKSCHVESIYRATDNEKQEIESLLKDGIIII